MENYSLFKIPSYITNTKIFKKRVAGMSLVKQKIGLYLIGIDDIKEFYIVAPLDSIKRSLVIFSSVVRPLALVRVPIIDDVSRENTEVDHFSKKDKASCIFCYGKNNLMNEDYFIKRRIILSAAYDIKKNYNKRSYSLSNTY